MDFESTQVRRAVEALQVELASQSEQTDSAMVASAWALLVLAVVGLLVPGAIGKTALCLAMLVGMVWTRHMVEQAGREWFAAGLTVLEHLAGDSPPERAGEADSEALESFQ